MMTSSKIAIALACLAAVSSATIATAADLSFDAPTSVDMAVKYATPISDRWSGFYAGGHLGGGLVNMPAGNDSDFAGGVQVGYNHQINQFVVGGELEGTYSNRLQYRLSTTGMLEQTWSGAAKARAGVAVGNILVYGTAGVNIARLEGKGSVTSGDRWQAGLLFGGGVEVALSEQLSGKVEYTQTRFNDVSSTIGGIGHKDNLANHAIKAGLNFRF